MTHLGYLGGVLNAATSLIYAGNGQYYHPTTGRFLSTDANPLALLALNWGKKKARGDASQAQA